MASSFEDLCSNFCAAAQVSAPELREQEDGLMAFTVLWREVAVDLMARPFEDPGHAFIVFHMGIPDPAHADFARILQTMLHTNFTNMRANQPVFSCHPETHAAMLQWVIPLPRLTGSGLHQIVEQGVDLVLQWRQTHFLAPAAAAAAASAVAAVNVGFA